MLPGIIFETLLNQSIFYKVYRGSREKSSKKIAIKIIENGSSTPDHVKKLKLEYDILNTLNIKGVLKASEFNTYNDNYFFIMEEVTGESLSSFIEQRQFGLRDVLQFGISISKVLGELHKINIIHRNLNPSNILWDNNSQQVRLFNFNFPINNDKKQALENGVYDNLIHYLSPEQTGRVNRIPDNKADLYSLGIILYEMLLGWLPFNSQDPMEIIYNHISKEPVQPHKANSAIPEVVSMIVNKLLSKTPENRYKTAYGLKNDLEKCLKEYNQKGIISYFRIGTYDQSDKFKFDDKIHGRLEEKELLRTALEEVKDGSSKFIIIEGPSGIGKTSLIKQYLQPNAEIEGYFTSGKFDQFNKKSPYSGFVQAIKKLIVDAIMTGDNSKTKDIKNILTENGGNILEILPELELITGKFYPLNEISFIEAKNRFNTVFKFLIQCFAEKDKPLVFFLDDLQWMDNASMDLLKNIYDDQTLTNILFVFTYNKKELKDGSALNEILKYDNENSVKITLPACNTEEINAMISEAANISGKSVSKLSEFLQVVSGGNPYFMKRIITTLNEEQMINFDYNKKVWTFDIKKIVEIKNKLSIVESLKKQLKELSPTAQDIIKLAACLGYSFDLKTISITGKKREEIDTALWEIRHANLVVPDNRTEHDTDAPIISFKFTHDKVQEVAYKMTMENKKHELHLKVGYLMMNIYKNKQINEKIFEIADHLNISRNLLPDELRLKAVEYNLIAGRKAKLISAFSASLDYFLCGIELIHEDDWKNNNKFVSSLYMDASEAAGIAGDMQLMENLFSIIKSKVKSKPEILKTYEYKMDAFLSRGKFTEAINCAYEALKYSGINIPRNATKLNVFLSYVNVNKMSWSGKPLSYQTMEDPMKLTVMRILYKGLNSALINNSQLSTLFLFKQILLSLKHGNAPVSPFANAAFGAFLCGYKQSFKTGYFYGEEALSLVKRMKLKEFEHKTAFIFNTYIRHWKDHISIPIDGLRHIFLKGPLNGDLEYSSYAGVLYYSSCFYSGHNIKKIINEMDHNYNYIKTLRSNYRFSYLYNSITELLSPEHTGEVINNNTIKRFQDQLDDNPTLFNIYMLNTISAYMSGELLTAKYFSQKAVALNNEVRGMYVGALCNMYDSLVRISLNDFSKESAKIITTNQKEMKQWSVASPDNFLNKYYLVKAELSAAQNKSLKTTISLYETAIKYAKQYGFTNEAALTNELLASCYLKNKDKKRAELFFNEAKKLYSLISYDSKVAQLEKIIQNGLEVETRIQREPEPLVERKTSVMQRTAPQQPFMRPDESYTLINVQKEKIKTEQNKVHDKENVIIEPIQEPVKIKEKEKQVKPKTEKVKPKEQPILEKIEGKRKITVYANKTIIGEPEEKIPVEQPSETTKTKKTSLAKKVKEVKEVKEVKKVKKESSILNKDESSKKDIKKTSEKEIIVEEISANSIKEKEEIPCSIIEESTSAMQELEKELAFFNITNQENIIQVQTSDNNEEPSEPEELPYYSNKISYDENVNSNLTENEEKVQIIHEPEIKHYDVLDTQFSSPFIDEKHDEKVEQEVDSTQLNVQDDLNGTLQQNEEQVEVVMKETIETKSRGIDPLQSPKKQPVPVPVRKFSLEITMKDTEKFTFFDKNYNI